MNRAVSIEGDQTPGYFISDHSTETLSYSIILCGNSSNLIIRSLLTDGNLAIAALSVIKIGFLNENIKEQLDIYKEKFDVVIINDGDFNYINKIVNQVLS